jgi:hypothetical protein
MSDYIIWSLTSTEARTHQEVGPVACKKGQGCEGSGLPADNLIGSHLASIPTTHDNVLILPPIH